MTATAVHMHPYRQLRLARGWQPIQLAGRMKILASRDGIALPDTWLMLKVIFLWENHRIEIGDYYAGLIARALDPRTWSSVDVAST